MPDNHNLKALTSLALLSTPIFSDDYLSTFLPFVATLALKKRYKEIEIKTVVSDFHEEYGLYIPRAPMQSILSRAIKTGLIEQRDNGKYYPIDNKMLEISFIHAEKSEKNKIKFILQKFIDFARENFKIEYDEQRAGECLIDFLDEYSPKSILMEKEIEEISSQASDRKDLYLVGCFISHVSKNDLSLFEAVESLAFSYLIVIAMSFDEPVEKRVSVLSNLTIYLDTNVVFRLLGLETDELKDAYIELFEMYRKSISPVFKVFRHTMDEMIGILQDCAKWINHPGYNPQLAKPALLSFIKKGFDATQINLYINRFEESLNENGISVDDGGYYDIDYGKHQIDEKILKTTLIQMYREHNPSYDPDKKSGTLQYDIQSIANIVKLWGNKSSRTYSRLGYLFLTSNTTLAYVCRRYSSDYWHDGKKHKSPCITDYYLGTMIWLSTPTERIQKVNKLKLLADCSAAMTLSKDVMDKFMIELEKLKTNQSISSEDYLLLRNESYQTNYLQNMTLNDETRFTDEMPEIILRRIKENIKRPLQDKIEQKEKAIDELRKEKEIQGEELEKIRRERENAREEEERRNKKIEQDAEKWNNRIENFIIPVFVAVLGIWRYNQEDNHVIQTALIIIGFLLVLFLGGLKCNSFKMHDKSLSLLKDILSKYQRIRQVISK